MLLVAPESAVDIVTSVPGALHHRPHLIKTTGCESQESLHFPCACLTLCFWEQKLTSMLKNQKNRLCFSATKPFFIEQLCRVHFYPVHTTARPLLLLSFETC